MKNSRFADDVVLMAKKLKDALEMLKELMEESQEVGLQINIKKTKILTKEKSELIKVEGGGQ